MVKQSGVKEDDVIRMMRTLSLVLKTAGFVYSTKLPILDLAVKLLDALHGSELSGYSPWC